MTITGEIDVLGTQVRGEEEILTPEAVRFIAALHEEFGDRRLELLIRRRQRRAALASGETLDFPTATAAVRADPTWRVAPPPPDLTDRRVEITGPIDRKMTVNALNSGAQVWMADFEDAATPSWENMITGQLNLRDALDRRIDFVSDQGKRYRIGEQIPTIMVRPRGWHLPEYHIRVDSRPVSASLVDFGLYFFHCARRQLERGSGPYFYLPKLESAAEAELWNDVFCFAQDQLGIPRGTIRATVLIETITAAFEMEEILYALRDHSAGLNAGRWDYIFSVIKTIGGCPKFVLPERSEVTMTVPFMRAYTELLVRTCHRRGAHAIGGMAAFIPNRRDPEVTARALEQVRQDKRREAADGFDGSWVAHPDLVPVCREVFDEVLGDRPHQIHRQREDVSVGAADLLAIDFTPVKVTEEGLRRNISVAIRYLESWLRGQGAVALDNQMEDTATAEIARAQVWQWFHRGVRLTDGRLITRRLVERLAYAEVDRLIAQCPDRGAPPRRYADARALFLEIALGMPMVEFLTLPAYQRYFS